jgi:hypothetical protein
VSRPDPLIYLLIHFYGCIRADFGAQAAAGAFAVTLKLRRMISLRINGGSNGNALFRTCLHAETATLATLLENNDIGFSLLFFSSGR